MGMQFIRAGSRLRLSYLDHRQQVATRDVVFRGLDYGENEWYAEPQLFLHCSDPSRQTDRSSPSPTSTGRPSRSARWTNSSRRSQP